MTAANFPTGAQYELRSADGRATAEITQVGASLRAFTVDGVDLVPRYPLDAATPAGSGIVLVPWPNRVRDGRWTQRGETRQLALTEPVTGNASHGLLRFASYSVAAQSEASVTLSAPVVPQTGYPFHLETTVTYALTGMTLDVTHTVTNVGADDAPVALGTHPYLCIGDVDTSDLVLTSPGATRFTLDERKLPDRRGAGGCRGRPSRRAPDRRPQPRHRVRPAVARRRRAASAPPWPRPTGGPSRSGRARGSTTSRSSPPTAIPVSRSPWPSSP